jgi:hypothetical protein
MDDQNTQVSDALLIARADLAIDQLKNLEIRLSEPNVNTVRKALIDAYSLLEEMKNAAVERTSQTNGTLPRIFYFTDKDNRPTTSIEQHTLNMRTGKPREIKRCVEISSIWALRVNDLKSFEDRFRIADSLDAARILKVLHNV